tara:strand:- start:1823 stop:2113 length:291 start_codon:yes stop_codon:yes gene_type:complete
MLHQTVAGGACLRRSLSLQSGHWLHTWYCVAETPWAVVTVEYECRISLAKCLTEKLDTVSADRRIEPYRINLDAGFGGIGIELNKYPRIKHFSRSA